MIKLKVTQTKGDKMKGLKIEFLTKLKVCLIDHSKMIRVIYKQVLQEAGYEVLFFDNTHDLETKTLSGNLPDFIISDETSLKSKLAQTLRQNKYSGLIILFTATDWVINDQSKYVEGFDYKLGGFNELLMTLQLSVRQMTKKGYQS